MNWLKRLFEKPQWKIEMELERNKLTEYLQTTYFNFKDGELRKIYKYIRGNDEIVYEGFLSNTVSTITNEQLSDWYLRCIINDDRYCNQSIYIFELYTATKKVMEKINK